MEIYVVWEIVIMLLVLSYFSYFVNRAIKEYRYNHVTSLTIYLGITVVVILTISIRLNFRSYAIFFLQILLVSLCLEVAYFRLKRVELFKYFHTSGILISIIAISLLIYDEAQMRKVVQTTYTLYSDKIDTLRILQITDLHMSDAMNAKQMQRYCEEMDDLDIDLVLLTGDIFEEKTSYEEMEKVIQVVSKINNELGIYYIFGNHDSITKKNKRGYTSQDIRNLFEKNNIVVLEDESITIENITIIGRKNIGLKKNEERIDIETFITTVNKDNYIIVLDHQPLDIEKNASLGIDLQLSGHTHGGYAYPLEYIQSLFTGQLPYGIRTINSFNAITSSGITFSKRTGAPNEYVYIMINP